MKTTDAQDKRENEILESSLSQVQQPRIGIPTTAEESHILDEKYAPMQQAPMVNKFRCLPARPNITETISGRAIISKASDVNFKAVIDNRSLIKKGLSTGSKKMFDTGCILLTDSSTRNAELGSSVPTEVSISLEDYGRSRGYDIERKATSTQAEADAEQKRIDAVMHNIRKKANAELNELYALSLSDKECKGSKIVDYTDIRVLQGKGIKNGYIVMKFSEPMAKYLMSAPISYYPNKLLELDERNPRTYNVGFHIALRYGMDSNVKRGTNNINSVKSLLAVADENWPSFEEIQASSDKGHWERRIKDPLTAILNTLQAEGILTSWEYCDAKKTKLTKKQLEEIDYTAFMNLYVRCEMPERPNQTARLLRKEESIKKAIDSKEKKLKEPSSSKAKKPQKG